MVPDIHFCRSATGARLAFATFGEGPVLLITPPWISSLEVQLEDPAWMGFYSRLARHHTVLVYDKQGCGLSERERTDFTWERDVEDARTVVDQLAPDRLSIFGASQGGPIAIAYAVRRREQVEKLVLYDTYARGADISRDGGASFVGLVRSNWGLGSRAMAALFLPENLDDPTALGVVLKWERAAATREMATRLLEALFSWDLSPLLPEVKVPTLVLHRRGDKAFHTGLGRDLAAGIPKARFVLLEGGGHLPWYGDCDAVLSSVAEFLGDDVADTLRPVETDAAGTAVADGAPAGGRPAVARTASPFRWSTVISCTSTGSCSSTGAASASPRSRCRWISSRPRPPACWPCDAGGSTRCGESSRPRSPPPGASASTCSCFPSSRSTSRSTPCVRTSWRLRPRPG